MRALADIGGGATFFLAGLLPMVLINANLSAARDNRLAFLAFLAAASAIRALAVWGQDLRVAAMSAMSSWALRCCR
ncbi:MAG: hypothetical protein JKY23_00505 [Nitrospinaceae bacterium]|nr:hypothetical protein [Nitrospinaceae bacterium]